MAIKIGSLMGIDRIKAFKIYNPRTERFRIL